jgi:aspartate oxidase
MEFMQFHPTAYYSKENPTLLVTEALRAKGPIFAMTQGEVYGGGSSPAELALVMFGALHEADL